MFARVTWAQSSPDRLEEAISRYRQQVVPAFSQVQGFMGAALLADRSTGAGVGVTYWDSLEAMQASEEAATNLRARVQEESGSRIIDIDRLEMIIQERTAPPRASTFVRVNELYAVPAKIDNLATLLRDRVLPVLKAQHGFRAGLVGVNRSTGRVIASSVWETAADREASNASVEGLRREFREMAGAQTVKVELYESVFAEVKQAALA